MGIADSTTHLIALQPPPSPAAKASPRQAPISRGLSILTVLTLLAIVLLIALLLILRRARWWFFPRAAPGTPRRRRPVDAWQESERRLSVTPHFRPGADDDTVDIDPGDPHPPGLGPEDVGPGRT